MWAAGDAMLAFFIACLFMVPTAFLIWGMGKREALYAAYSKFLLGLSLTTPVCLGRLLLAESHLVESLSSVFFLRLLATPFTFVGIGISWFAARFDRSKRVVGYA